MIMLRENDDKLMEIDELAKEFCVSPDWLREQGRAGLLLIVGDQAFEGERCQQRNATRGPW